MTQNKYVPEKLYSLELPDTIQPRANSLQRDVQLPPGGSSKLPYNLIPIISMFQQEPTEPGLPATDQFKTLKN